MQPAAAARAAPRPSTLPPAGPWRRRADTADTRTELVTAVTRVSLRHPAFA